MKFRIVTFLIYWTVRSIAWSIRLHVIGEEHVESIRRQGSGVILVTWHGRTLIPIACLRDRGYWAITSTSRDGEYQNSTLKGFGWNTVRGSTSARGAIQAALTMTRHLMAGAVLAFTPDGPRGPSHHVQPGSIFMAQKSGCPIIPVGISAFPRKLMPAWDRYLLPLPFSKAAFIYGEPIFIPPDAKSEEEQRYWADRVADAIDALEAEAERIVGVSGRTANSRDANQWHRA